MINLILSIIFATSLFVVFKYFDVFRVKTLQAIVVNYFIASLFGLFYADAFGKILLVPEQTWFLGALILGILFISIFFVMAKTSQENGVAVASVSGKMSLVIPIAFGVILYNETITWLKLLGIVLALVSVYLTSVKNESSKSLVKASLLFPILLFLGSGVIDTLIKFIETNYVKDVPFFSGSLFAIAFILGSIILLVRVLLKKEKLEAKSIVAGVILGVPNYYSIIFLIKALQIEYFESSTLFTINNIGVVVLSAFLGVFLFKEKLNTKNIIGIITAVIGIVLVAIA